MDNKDIRNYVTLPLSKENIDIYYNTSNLNNTIANTYYKKKKKKGDYLHSIISNYDDTIINLHNSVCDKYNNIGFLNNSKIQDFSNLIIDNISIYNNPIRSSVQYEESQQINDESVDDSFFNNEISDKYYYM